MAADQLAEAAETLLDCVGSELEAKGYPDVHELVAAMAAKLRQDAAILNDLVFIPELDLNDLARRITREGRR